MKTLDPALVVKDYKSGLSTRALAAKYGVGKTFMAKFVKKAGCSLRPQSHDRQAVLPQIIEQYEEGKAINAIAQELGLANATVKRWLQEEVQLREWQKDLTGQVFGRLTAERRAEGKGKTQWECRCSCGGRAVVPTYALTSGNSKSCGCLKHSVGVKMRIDATGERYGRLVAVKPVRSIRRAMHWEFRCDCGKVCVKSLGAVRAGNTKSCGCLLDGVERAARLRVDITGLQVGLLTAERRVGETRDWEWRCACGGLKVATKHSVEKGLVKSCGCLTRGEDSIDAWLGERFRNPSAEAVLYVFPLARFAGYAKVGIATDMGKRKSGSGGEYGDVHDYIAMPRLDAWLVEQALLHATKYIAGCPAELADAKWGGYTEVRRMSPPAAFKLALDLYDQLQELGRSEFAIRYVPMTPAKQRAVAKLVA